MVELGGAHGVTHGRAAHRHVHPARPGHRQRGRGDRVGRGAGRRRPGRRGGADPGPGPGDARRRRPAGRRPGGGAARRPGDGLLAGDDPGAGRRPGRAAAERAARSRWSAPTPTASSRPSTRTPWGWPPGGSAPAGPARRTRSASPAGVVLHKRPGDPVRAGDPLYELRAEDATRIPAALAEAAARRSGSRRPRRPRRRWSSSGSADRWRSGWRGAGRRSRYPPWPGGQPALSRREQTGIRRDRTRPRSPCRPRGEPRRAGPARPAAAAAAVPAGVGAGRRGRAAPDRRRSRRGSPCCT